MQTANPAFYQLFQVHPADTLGRRIYDLGNGQWAIPELWTLLEDILPHRTLLNDFEVSHAFPQLGHRTMLLNPRYGRIGMVAYPYLYLLEMLGLVA